MPLRRPQNGSRPLTEDEVDAADQAAVYPAQSERGDLPSVDDVLQDELDNDPTFRVRVENPLRVDELPSSLGGVRTFTIPAGASATKIGNDDPRRKAITVYSPDGDFWLAGDPATVESSAGFYVGANVPLTLGVRNALFVRPVDAALTIRLSVLVEQWAR